MTSAILARLTDANPAVYWVRVRSRWTGADITLTYDSLVTRGYALLWLNQHTDVLAIGEG